MSHSKEPSRYGINDNPTKEEMAIIKNRLVEYNMEQTNGDWNKPEIEINLMLKDDAGTILGGINASTLCRVMWLELLWVDEKYRGLGYGKALILKAEKIAKENGCISGQTWVLSFQAPGFFQKLGYEAFAVSDGWYPKGVKEYDFIKRF